MLDVENRERSAGHGRKLILDALAEIGAESGDAGLSAWQDINESCRRRLLEAHTSEEEARGSCEDVPRSCRDWFRS